MKIYLIFFVIIFTTTIVPTSFAKWIEVSKTITATYYLDFERIRKVEEFVYYWYMKDNLQPDEYGNMSFKYYSQVDCNLFRERLLSGSIFKESMGIGTGKSESINGDWTYPSPDTLGESFLKAVCNY